MWGYDVMSQDFKDGAVPTVYYITDLHLLNMSLYDAIRIDTIRRHIAPHLSAADHVRLCRLNRDFYAVLYDDPLTWRSVDLATTQYPQFADLFEREAVCRGVWYLSLDCAEVSYDKLYEILGRLPNLRRLSMVGVSTFVAHLDAVTQLMAIVKSLPERLPHLQHVGLLGAPLFSSSSENRLASKVRELLRRKDGTSIDCDLWPCPWRHPFQDPNDSEVWYLCSAVANVCVACGVSERNCYTCTSARFCRGCQRFWCHSCRHDITRVCYECGYSCASCKEGIIATCTECSSRFCKLHSRDTTSRYARPAQIGPSLTTVHPLDEEVGHLSYEAIGQGRTTGLEKLSQTTSAEDLDKCCDWCIQGTLSI